MLHKVNVALQVLPSSTEKHPYALVDEAITVIKNSGLRYQVCPFETVIEGDYDKIMEVIKDVQQACINAGADSLLSYVKIQVAKDMDVSIEDKMKKYQ